ncbi:MAG: T9SS type A sorting domain-containing protein [Flavobacteriales bacterium]
MKKVLLTTFALIALLTTNAQLVVFSGESNNFTGSVSNIDDEEIEIGWLVINPSMNTVNVKLKTEVVDLVAGSEYQYCWGLLCSNWLDGAGNLPEVVSIGPDATSDTHHVKFRHYGFSGCSIIRLIWYEENNESNMVAYEIAIGVDSKDCAVNVTEITTAKADITSISPNPVVKVSTIGYDFNTVPEDGKIQIHNMVGELMKEIEITKKTGVVTIEAADFESGIYFCSIQCEGRVFETKRMVVTK